MLSTGVRTDLGVKIFGNDLNVLKDLAIQAEAILKPINGAADVVAERVTGGNYIDIEIDREAAARTYAKWEASSLPTADVARIIGTPGEITFTVTPNRTLMIAETMHKVGLLKTKPAAWTDYFHAGLHGMPGPLAKARIERDSRQRFVAKIPDPDVVLLIADFQRHAGLVR